MSSTGEISHSKKVYTLEPQLLFLCGSVHKINNLSQDFIKQDLFLYEAKASREYWRGVEMLVKDHIEFGGRGKDTLFNKLLNIGYHYLSKKVEKAIINAGLWPEIGMLHSYRRGNKPLVYDLMELFKQPLVDLVAISFVRNWKNKRDEISQKEIKFFVNDLKHDWGKLYLYNESLIPTQEILEFEVQKLKNWVAKESAYDPYLRDWSHKSKKLSNPVVD